MNTVLKKAGNRFHRPDEPTTLWIQPRDMEILRVIGKFRFLRSDHVHELVFFRTILRTTQKRLRKLWEHGFVDRHYLPFVFGRDAPRPRYAGGAIYSLTAKGAALISVKNPPRSLIATIHHYLVSIDLLVAVMRAARNTRERHVAVETENELWQAAKRRRKSRQPLLVPDAAISFHEAEKTPRTFLIEIVRADPRGGIDSLRTKMEAYGRAQAESRLAELYGMEQVVAVLFLAGSMKRAENLAAAARKLSPRVRRLFWFGSYSELFNGDTPSDSILGPRFITADNKSRSFIPHPLPYDTPSPDPG